MPTITYTARLITDSCWCGIEFAMPEQLHRQFAEEGKTVYCPLGHTCVVKETETVRLRKQLAAEQSRATALRDQLGAADRTNSALRGQITKAKKRAAGGACPCCNRTFVQLARHMTTKHPDYVPKEKE
jgi:hypothetical protein